jgi:RNA ligase (TIGR02306 family)
MTTEGKKLVQITPIVDLRAHPNADRLEIATVLGWDVIVVKDYFKVGEEIVFIEVDSMIPKEAAWLDERTRSKIRAKNEYFRVVTTKIRDVYSQGLIVNIDDIEKITGPIPMHNKDLRNILGIVRYVKPDVDDYCANLDDATPFPSHLFPRSCEKRVQSTPKNFNALRGQEYWATLKIDGTSATYSILDDKFLVCSRNQVKGLVPFPEKGTFPESNDLYINTGYRCNIYKVLLENPYIAIQGEVYGTKISVNRLNVKCVHFAVYHIYDVGKHIAWTYPEMVKFCEENKLEVVPLIEHGILGDDDTITKAVERSKGVYPGTKNVREGLVWRNADNRNSFKVINPDYLIKTKR